DRGDLQLLAVDLQRIAQRLGVGLEGDFTRYQSRRAHVDADLAVGANVQLDDAALGLDAYPAPGGQALVQHEARDAARAVAAWLHFRTVGIEDRSEERRVG